MGGTTPGQGPVLQRSSATVNRASGRELSPQAGNGWAAVISYPKRRVDATAQAPAAPMRNSPQSTQVPKHQQQKNHPTASSKRPAARRQMPYYTKAATVNGTMDYKQLKEYLSGQAPVAMVIDTAIRLRDKACTRRFQAYSSRQPAEVDLIHLRSEWESNYRVPTGYGGYHRQWNLQRNEEATILMVELKDWVITKGLPQREVEQRLMAFDFIAAAAATEGSCNANSPGSFGRFSFKDAVSGSRTESAEGTVREAELKELYDICVAPAQPTTSLRSLTAQESRAMDMLMSGSSKSRAFLLSSSTFSIKRT